MSAWAQSFTSMTLKLRGRGASVASDPYGGGLGGLPENILPNKIIVITKNSKSENESL